MFFESGFGLLRVIVVGSLAYGVLILVLRISGKRTLAKLNAFDVVVTVALGSTLSTVLLSKSVALAEGVLAFIVLAGLQYAVAWLSVRSKPFSDLVKSEPTLLLRDGQFLREAMRRQRVTEVEVVSALRNHGVGDADKVAAVVLETDGTFSIIEQGPAVGTRPSTTAFAAP